MLKNVENGMQQTYSVCSQDESLPIKSNVCCQHTNLFSFCDKFKKQVKTNFTGFAFY